MWFSARGSWVPGELGRRAALWCSFLNRLLTVFQNLSCFPPSFQVSTGYRRFADVSSRSCPCWPTRTVVFDNQMLTEAIAFGFQIGEISSPTKYFPEASRSISDGSVVYDFGVLVTSLLYRLWRSGDDQDQAVQQAGDVAAGLPVLPPGRTS